MGKNDIETFKRITLLIEDTLFKYQKILITALPNYDSYLDQRNKNLIKKYVSPRGLITNCNNKILKRVNLLQTNFESSTTYAIQTLETANNRLKNTLIISVIILILSSLILTYTIITLFVFPISKIKHSLDELSLGILPPNISNQRRDEIGEIVNKLNELTTNLKKTAEFSLELGKEIVTPNSKRLAPTMFFKKLFA
ncbi:MAG: hypothetical protein IPO21_04825 [Bacteroidales bacterium]|nr:hypothetical protein [Bacteroidales bacterium]